MIRVGGADGTEIALVDAQRTQIPVIASFVRFLGARGCSPHTVKAYLHDLKFLFGYLSSSGLTVEQFDIAHSIDFIAYLTDRRRVTGGRRTSTPAVVSDRLAPATVNRVLAAVSTFYEHLLLTHALEIVRNPLDAGYPQQQATRRTGRRSMRLRTAVT